MSVDRPSGFTQQEGVGVWRLITEAKICVYKTKLVDDGADSFVVRVEKP